jgi:CheY-like chemotaxis protein
MSGEQVLVVDDNATNVKLLSFLLAAKGYLVRTAADAEQALRAVAQERPRLILMDLQLPGTDGLTLTRQLRADPSMRGVVIVAVTASAMTGDRERALEAGCDGFIPKPIDTRAFPGLVAEYLARGTDAGAAR